MYSRDLSIVIPVFNSANCIVELVTEIVNEFSKHEFSYEIILVDDGSKDNSWGKIYELKNKYNFISGIKLGRNYGQHKATLCGLIESRGQYVVTMDDDMEHDPKSIPLMFSKIKNLSSDLLYGIPSNKKRGLIKSLAVSFYKWVSKVENIDAGKGSSFRILSNNLKEKIVNHNSHLFYMDEMLLWYTESISTEPLQFRKTKKIDSGYTFRTLFSLSQNVFMISTTMPLTFVKFLGFSVSSVSFLYGIYHLFHKIFLKTEKGYTSLIISILFSTGLILLCIGIIGEYLGNVLMMQNGKPAFSIKEKI
ncbi:MAG: glycosyltransferase family 2 protein [Bacteroidota bacterium]